MTTENTEPEKKSKYFYFEYEVSRSEFEVPYMVKFNNVGNKKELVACEAHPAAPPTALSKKQCDEYHRFKLGKWKRYGPFQFGGAIGRFHNKHGVRAIRSCWVLNKKGQKPEVRGFLELKTPITLAKFNPSKGGSDLKVEMMEGFPSVVTENYNVQCFW